MRSSELSGHCFSKSALAIDREPSVPVMWCRHEAVIWCRHEAHQQSAEAYSPKCIGSLVRRKHRVEGCPDFGSVTSSSHLTPFCGFSRVRAPLVVSRRRRKVSRVVLPRFGHFRLGRSKTKVVQKRKCSINSTQAGEWLWYNLAI